MSIPSPSDLFVWVDSRWSNPIKTYCNFPVTVEREIRVKDLATGKTEYENGMEVKPEYFELVEMLGQMANTAYMLNTNLPHSEGKWLTLKTLEHLCVIIAKSFEPEKKGDSDAEVN